MNTYNIPQTHEPRTVEIPAVYFIIDPDSSTAHIWLNGELANDQFDDIEAIYGAYRTLEALRIPFTMDEIGGDDAWDISNTLDEWLQFTPADQRAHRVTLNPAQASRALAYLTSYFDAGTDEDLILPSEWYSAGCPDTYIPGPAFDEEYYEDEDEYDDEAAAYVPTWETAPATPDVGDANDTRWPNADTFKDWSGATHPAE